jgi:Mg-chelatase subunit ChlD
MVAVKSQVTDYESAAKQADLDIVLVVDVSISMDGPPLETMKKLMLYLIDQLKENHRLGK